LAPDTLEPGDSLEVTGDSLPLNREGELELRGLFHAPGHHPAAVHLTLPVRVVSTSLARVAGAAGGPGAFAGRGTFVGAARLSFAATDGALVTGRLAHVRFDVRADASGGVASRVAAEQEAAAFAHTLGLDIESVDGERGLRVARVDSSSPAEDAGVAPDDVLLRLGEVGLGALGDFRPSPRADMASLAFERHGEPRRAVISLDQTPRDPLRSVALTCLALLASLSFFLSPAGRLLDPNSRPHRRHLRLRHLLIGAIGLGLIAAFSRLFTVLQVDLLLWTALLSVTGLGLSFGHGPERHTLWRLLRRVFIVEVSLFAVTGATLLSAGASTLAELAARRASSGGASLFSLESWPLVTDPLVALGAFAFCAILLQAPEPDGQGWPRRLAAVAYRGLGASLFLVVFANGAQLLGARPLVFIIEACAVAALLSLAAPFGARLSKLLPILALATALLSIAPASFRGDLPHGPELWAGFLICFAIVALGLVLRWRRRPQERWLVHPFL